MGVFRSTKKTNHNDGPPDAKDYWYPSVNFTTKELPEIATWQPGETYELTIKVKQTSKSVYKDETEATEEAAFDITEVAATGDDDAYSKVEKKLKLEK